MQNIDLYGLAAVISALTSFGAMITSMVVALRQKKIAAEADVQRTQLKTLVEQIPSKETTP